MQPRKLRRYEYTVQRLLNYFLLLSVGIGNHPEHVPSTSTLRPGSLVILGSAPDGDWHLSFYKERVGEDEHVLESVLTGELCKWSNVRLTVLPQQFTVDNPMMYWSDEKFDFAAKFIAEKRKGDYYLTVPYIRHNLFTDETFCMETRTRWNLTEYRLLSDPIPWRDMTRSQLRKLMKEHVAKHEAFAEADIAKKKEQS